MGNCRSDYCGSMGAVVMFPGKNSTMYHAQLWSSEVVSGARREETNRTSGVNEVEVRNMNEMKLKLNPREIKLCKEYATCVFFCNYARLLFLLLFFVDMLQCHMIRVVSFQYPIDLRRCERSYKYERNQWHFVAICTFWNCICICNGDVLIIFISFFWYDDVVSD